MRNSGRFRESCMNALATLAYIFAIAIFFHYAKNVFGEKDHFLTPVFMLLLLIISASVTGFLVLGKPVQLYLDGKKKESIELLFATILWLAGFAFTVAVALFAMR